MSKKSYLNTPNEELSTEQYVCKLEEALTFYADPRNHDTCIVVGYHSLTPVTADGGVLGRKVLGWKE